MEKRTCFDTGEGLVACVCQAKAGESGGERIRARAATLAGIEAAPLKADEDPTKPDQLQASHASPIAALNFGAGARYIIHIDCVAKPCRRRDTS